VRASFARLTRGVRWRSTAAAVVVTAMALVGAAVVLLLALRSSTTATVLQQARQQAASITAELVKEGPTELAGVLVAAPDSPGVAQVIDPNGTVIARTPDAATQPLSTMRPAPGQQTEQTSATLPGEDDRAAVVAVGVQVNGTNYVVLTAEPLGSVNDAVGVALGALAIGVPVLLLIVGATVYWLVGRALAPVEAIRAEVSAIEQADLSRRVPQPDGQDEISNLARTMNDMLGRLELAQRSQRRFVADASHELRSPLATLRTHLDLAARAGGQLDDDAVAAMSSELNRLASLVDDLLLLARADERGLARPRREVDLDDILDAERIRLQGTTSLRISATIAPVKVFGDRAQLARLVRNLTDNAVRHAKASLSLSLRVENDRAVLAVADDGPGIPVADRERVFHRFVRLDEARSGSSGGLGLAIVAEITSIHGGTVRIDDGRIDEHEGSGARFVVDLPRAQPPSAASR
jgi:signal transduction histidine kinase